MTKLWSVESQRPKQYWKALLNNVCISTKQLLAPYMCAWHAAVCQKLFITKSTTSITKVEVS